MCIPLAGPVVVDTTLGLSLEPDHLPPAQVQAPISHLNAYSRLLSVSHTAPISSVNSQNSWQTVL